MASIRESLGRLKSFMAKSQQALGLSPHQIYRYTRKQPDLGQCGKIAWH